MKTDERILLYFLKQKNSTVKSHMDFIVCFKIIQSQLLTILGLLYRLPILCISAILNGISKSSAILRGGAAFYQDSCLEIYV